MALLVARHDGVARQQFGVEVVANPQNADLDVWLCHGLNSDRRAAWTCEDGSEFFWPGDCNMLAAKLPQARIIMFGTDTHPVRLTGPITRNTVRDLARHMADAIQTLREESTSLGRPLVFLVHSYGGLICKQCLLLSKEQESLRDIFTSTLGVLFLGTPHNGAPLANFAQIAANALNYIGRGNQGQLRDLSPDAEGASGIREDYARLLHNNPRIKTHCFYETVPTSFLGCIVSKESACMLGYDCSPLNKTHSGMVKFRSPEDDDFKIVAGVLVRWHAEQTTTFHASADQASPRAGDNTEALEAILTPSAQPVGQTNTFSGNFHARNIMQAGSGGGGTQNFTFN